MTPRQRRQIGVLVGMALLVNSVGLGGASTAWANLDEKRVEAARIQSELDARAERIAGLDQQFDAAQRKTEAASAAVQRARAELAAADRRMAETTSRLATQAVEVYVRSTSVSFLEHVSESDGTDLSVRNQYLKTTAGGQREALEDLRAAREDLLLRRAGLEEAEQSTKSATAALQDRLQALSRGEDDQRATLARVNGELAQLLRQEQARRSALALGQAQAAAASRPAPARTGARPVTAQGPTPSSPGGVWACIRQRESGNNYRAPGGGAYQFKGNTWQSLGGTGRPEDADPATQDAMAVKLQQRSGWSQWTTARGCGAVD